MQYDKKEEAQTGISQRLASSFEAWGQMLRNAVIWPGRAALFIGGVALVSTAALTLADVILRNLFSVVVPGSLELTGFLTILITLSAVGVVEIERKHIQVDLLIGQMPDFLSKPTLAGGLLLTFILMCVTTFQIWTQAEYLRGNNIVTGVLSLPEWPFVVAAATFVLLFAVALLSNLLSAIAEVLRLADIRSTFTFGFWVLVAILMVVAIFYPEHIPIDLPRSTRGIISILLCFTLIFLGVHVAAAMATTALVGISWLISSNASLTSLRTTTIDVVSNETWSVVPLFIWMGLVVVASGFARDLYHAAHRWIGHLPGGLASASTVACAGLSSIVGDTLSGVYSMGSIALPEMRAHGYDMRLATASIACAATIGVMVPPSIAFIVYGMITEVSIGKLFVAGILPGILFALILISLITIRAMITPSLAPRGEKSSWSERFQATKGIWPVLLLMLLVLGGIYGGFVTPNEAASLGISGALLIALVMGRLTFQGFVDAIAQTLRLTASILIIFMFATAFSRFVAISGFTQQLADWVVNMGLGRYQLIGAILVFYVFIGMFMNALPALVLTVPLFFPVAMNAGFDPVWFGVLVVIMVELGVVTPPIGVNVFAIAAVAEDVPMYEIFRGVLPFWLAYLALVVLIIAFPSIALYLPSLM